MVFSSIILFNPSVFQRGKQQQHELGTWLRQRYLGTVVKQRYNSNDIYVQSTDYDRTLQSAIINTNAMYPPTPEDRYVDTVDFNPIPIHTVPKHLDASLGMERHCPEYDRLFNKSVGEFTSRLFDENKKLLQYLRKHTGFELETLWRVQDLYDTMFIQELNGMR